MTLLLLPVKTNLLDHLVVLNGIKAVTASCSHDWIPLNKQSTTQVHQIHGPPFFPIPL